MSLVNAIRVSPDKAAESFPEPKKHSKISYTREFLLSLSGLDVCKNLPSGFDRSTLSEFEDAFQAIQDRHRIPGSLPLQGYGHADYGTSPPTRGDSSNYSRGSYGRWDNRSSGRNERDSDSQSDWDSDSGRRHSNQSRRSWQNSEHDGLLGSGSFPRPSGFPAGLSAPKVRSNDLSQLNRSTEPYQPPRPYKAVPHSRRENSDSFNDETFGSAECTSQDRAEEERRRRESFELMRKEQQKAFQEKQKLNPNKHKDDHVSDLCKLLGDTKERKSVLNRSNELDEIVTQAVSNNDSSKSSLQTSGARPLVPPGFKSTTLEMNSSTRSLTHSHSAEVSGRLEIEESLSHAKAIVQNGSLDNQEEAQSVQKMDFREKQHEDTSFHTPNLNKVEQVVDSSAEIEVSYRKLGMDNQLYRTSSLSEASETLDGSEIIEFETKMTGNKIVIDSKQDHSMSILEKLFNSALTVNLSGSSGFVEHHDSERDDTRSPNAVQSSKFAHWFLEDEKKAAEDPSYAKPSDLLSLIVGGEKGGSQVSDVKPTHILPDITLHNLEHANRYMTSSPIGLSEQFYNSSKEEKVSSILTCEDLEQTILSEYSESSSTLQASGGGWSVSGAKTEESKADIDDRASQHLLSLLQKGTTGLKDIAQSPNLDNRSSDKLHISEGAIVGTSLNSREEKADSIPHSGKNLTLETLFGSAFMKELQSAEAPVSIQRGSVGSAGIDISEQQGLPFGIMGDTLFPTSTVGIESNRSNHESNVLQSSQGQQTKSDKIESWLGFNDTQVEVDRSKHGTSVVSKLGGFDGAVDIQLPEEESLITVGDPVNNTPFSMFMSAGNSTKGELLSSNKPVDIVEKLAALNSVFKDERAMVGWEGTPFVRGPYNPMEPEIPYRNLRAQPSSQFHPHQMNPGRPFFRPLDSHPTHLNSQMNFMVPEGNNRQDAPANHQFRANMLRPPFHHPNPNTGRGGFELPHHHPMLQQMQAPGNFPPHHLLREFPRGGPLAPHPSNQATGFMQELNPMQGFPFRHQQPNFGGPGMSLPGPDVSGGSNHPEAFQRLLEMELRANSKQIHPFAAVGHSQGMYGHELDLGFRHR
ncbi:uncharacterized protein LOC114299389 [Camellia sinensis]|uniref:uncharacterized protein LOC114299389 n=1 Tax=Camellia sinensis TaxID=4442 RepID=UPI001036CB2C|nr:uncharacterized protein LOC114299389 [Camellia sinensis]